MECCICYNKFHIYGILDCSHKFCTDCLYKWLGNNSEQTPSTCPLCREKYKLDNIKTYHEVRKSYESTDT